MKTNETITYPVDAPVEVASKLNKFLLERKDLGISTSDLSSYSVSTAEDFPYEVHAWKVNKLAKKLLYVIVKETK